MCLIVYVKGLMSVNERMHVRLSAQFMDHYKSNVVKWCPEN